MMWKNGDWDNPKYSICCCTIFVIYCWYSERYWVVVIRSVHIVCFLFAQVSPRPMLLTGWNWKRVIRHSAIVVTGSNWSATRSISNELVINLRTPHSAVPNSSTFSPSSRCSWFVLLWHQHPSLLCRCLHYHIERGVSSFAYLQYAPFLFFVPMDYVAKRAQQVVQYP